MRAIRPIGLVPLAAVVMWCAVAARAASDQDQQSGQIVPGPLDGKTFRGALGPDGKPKDTPDVFVFADGTFVSKECELRCQYPARPYFVRVSGDRIDFISETRCPYKDARITWRGSVVGDRIVGKSTWLVRRWYWTVENTFEFEGRLVPQAAASTAID